MAKAMIEALQERTTEGPHRTCNQPPKTKYLYDMTLSIDYNNYFFSYASDFYLILNFLKLCEYYLWCEFSINITVRSGLCLECHRLSVLTTVGNNQVAVFQELKKNYGKSTKSSSLFCLYRIKVSKK